MSHYIYIVKCSDGTLYTGYTNDLQKRINAHNNGTGAKYTKTRRPVELVYSEEFETKTEAMSREWHIKHDMSREEKLRMIEGKDVKKKEKEPPVFNSISDFFGWRCNGGKSVESYHTEDIKDLGWIEETDVLYSFLLCYKLGLEIVCEKAFKTKIKGAKDENTRLNTNSPNFLRSCAEDDAFKKVNNSKPIKEFLKLYFSIGNVIPMWPGGNSCKGIKGIYDSPEVFFNMYPEWTETLREKYKEKGFLDSVMKYRLESMFKTVDTLRKMTSAEYFAYITKRCEIIAEREKAIKEWLAK